MSTQENEEVVIGVASALAIAYVGEVDQVIVAPAREMFAKPAAFPSLTVRARGPARFDERTGKVRQRVTVGVWRRVGTTFQQNLSDLTRDESQWLVEKSLLRHVDGDLVHLFPEGPALAHQVGDGIELVLETWEAHWVPEASRRTRRLAYRKLQKAA